MKHQKFTLIILFFLFLLSNKIHSEETPFTTILSADTSIKYNFIINSNDTIDLKNINNLICGFSVDCKIKQKSEQSFVRIIMEDTNKQNYVVIECNRLRNDTDSVIYKHYCEETFFIENVQPSLLKFYVKDAVIEFEGINVANTSQLKRSNTNIDKIKNVKKEQATVIAQRINEYNIKNKKLWTAGVTPRSLMNYEDLKRSLGIESDDFDTGGLEYYTGGIFEVGLSSNATNTHILEDPNDSLFVKSFDWRNRHGRNWITEPKNQGNSGYCVAFAICGMLEAKANLFYNRDLDLDLSEQDIVQNYAREGYSNIDYIYTYGMNRSNAMNCVVNYGIVDEICTPFVDSVLYEIPDRNINSEMLFINNFNSIYTPKNQIGNVKKTIIDKGPVISGLTRCGVNHAMTLVGFHKIQAGDTVNNVKLNVDGGLHGMTVVPENDERIGHTYWVFKDNYGYLDSRINGYMHVLFYDYSCMPQIDYTDSPIISTQYSEDDIICQDNDGDGFYFWGIGDKPLNCPDWVSDIPDGDDSDYSKGPIDEFGNLKDINSFLNDTIYINNDSVLNNIDYIYSHIIICTNSKLTILNEINLYKNVTITIKNGGTLLIDGGCINNATIIAENGSNVEFLNDGSINIAKNKNLDIPLGATLYLQHGTINN